MPCFLKPEALATTRRGTLAGLAGSGLLAALPSTLRAQSATPNTVFRHGVASGDPDATSVVLWTRVTAEGGGEVELRCQVARDEAFGTILREESLRTGPERDHTAKLLAGGLEPGATYYYRFLLGGAVSPVGRAPTVTA